MKPKTPYINAGRGGGHQGVVHACEEVRPVIERGIKELSALHESPIPHSKTRDMQGGKETLCHRCETIDGSRKFDAYARRLYDVQTGISKSVQANIVDVWFLALDADIEDEGIAKLASTTKGAWELVDAYLWANDIEISEIEQKRLEHFLLNFSFGYLNWDAEIVFEEKAEEAAA